MQISRLYSEWSTKQSDLKSLNKKRAYLVLCVIAAYLYLNVFSASVTSNENSSLRTNQKSENSWPDVAWLLAYPNSGDDYIRHLIHRVSGLTTATNYGNELGVKHGKIPFVSRTENGPYRANDKPFPERYIATKTFCTNTCINCNAPYIHKNSDFLDGCAAGHHILDDSGRTWVKYDHKVVKKAIHLIRNPLENIVARFQWSHRLSEIQNNNNWKYKADRDGFIEWCHDLDKEFALRDKRWLIEDVAAIAKNIPCHGLFHQYAHWHNKVFEMLEQNGIDAHIIHYQDYQYHIEKTTMGLLKFLELPIKGVPPQFVTEPYEQYYTQEDQMDIYFFLKVVASQQTWVELKRYSLSPMVENNPYSRIGSAISPYHGSWPNIAWLMSFPNSGTYFMTHLVQIATGTVTATNYANELGPRYYIIPNASYSNNGPFRTSKRPFPEKYILTKTHCSGFCSQTECSPKSYFVTQEKYLSKCTKGGKFSNDDKIEDGDALTSIYYDPKEVKKVVHLIRNPFDNIVARFHFVHKRHALVGDTDRWNYSYDKFGFREWCKMYDSSFTDEIQQFYPSDIYAAAKTIPCHAEFYQFVAWHNNAFEVSRKLNIPSLVLYYEDNHNDLQGNIAKLFGFLDLRANRSAPDFKYNGGYGDYYSEQERASIISFIKLLSSEETFNHLKRYF